MTSIRLRLLLCVMIWGWTFVAVKICLGFLHPLEVIAIRFLIGLPLLYAILRWKRIPVQFIPGDVMPIVIGSTIIAIHFILQTIALTHTTAVNTGWIIGVSPLAIALFSFLLLRERIGRWEITGIVLATGGIFLLVFNGSLNNFGWAQSAGDWAILCSAGTWALYTIASRDLSRRRHPLSVTLVMFIPVTIICGVVMLATTTLAAITALTWKPIAAILFLAVPGMLAQWIWQEGVAKLGAAKAGIFLYLEPLATTALAIPLLAEPATMYTFGGGILVLFGVWLAERRKGSG